MGRQIRTYEITVRVDITSIARDDPDREHLDVALAIDEAYQLLGQRVNGHDIDDESTISVVEV